MAAGRCSAARYFYEQGFRPALVGAGLTDRYVFHSLRHHCASVMLAEGAPITAVAAHLGDAVETVERVYAHWLPEDDWRLDDVLERMHARPPTRATRTLSAASEGE